MITCTVYEPPEPPADRIDRAETFVFVRDGFSWGAFLLTPLWLLVNRLWLPLAAFILLAGAIGGAVEAHLLPGWTVLIVLAVQAVTGFEAGALRSWKLERRGWRPVGVVSGWNTFDCERRFFDAWLPGQPVLATPGPVVSGGAAARRGRFWRWPLLWQPGSLGA